MNFYDLIKNRRSVRDYAPERKVDEEILKRILNAGRLAPSAANRQPWRLLAVKSPDKLAAVKECYGKPWFRDAPAVLAAVGDEEKAWNRSDGYCALETDLTIAMDHMILAAEYEGLGTCWIAAFDEPILRRALSLSESEKVFAITPLGYPRDGYIKKQGPQRKDFDDICAII
ncbi:MAG: nitroreductase family protein [Fibrobacterota bacterium]